MKIVEYNKIKSSVYNVLLEYFYYRTKKKFHPIFILKADGRRGTLTLRLEITVISVM